MKSARARADALMATKQRHVLTFETGHVIEWTFDWGMHGVPQRDVQIEGSWLVVRHVTVDRSGGALMTHSAAWEAVYPVHAVSSYEVFYESR